ncbi:MAG: RNA polymerase sporulation sigma factor SigK [Christensenellales bacterium]|jgi:RNA polymerase sporulation-specific sigma factor
MFKKLFEKIKTLLKRNYLETNIDILLYICGNDALPLPLEPEEEEILLEELQNDNMAAREKLVEHNLRLVVYIAKKFDNTGMELEDLISIGAIGLIKAIRTFKPDKNIKLATYASRCIENEILMQLRKSTKIKTEVSLEEPLKTDGDGNELVLADVLCFEEESVSSGLELTAEKQILFQSLRKLHKREQEIMILRFGLFGEEEKTQKEVADYLGISQSYISRIEKKILNKMKKELDKISSV